MLIQEAQLKKSGEYRITEGGRREGEVDDLLNVRVSSLLPEQQHQHRWRGLGRGER